jgi:HlyD family secretion protein
MFARLTKATLVLFTVIGILVAVGVYRIRRAGESVTSFRTTVVQRGDLFSTVGAKGTVEPEEVVDVGAQVVGRIKALGIDPNDPAKSRCVDHGSLVYDGTVLALIDDAVYRAQLDHAEAALQWAQAELAQAQAQLDQTEKDLRRALNLVPLHAIAECDYEAAMTSHSSSVANVAAAKATIRQNEALVQLARTNLDYTVIRSPVPGIILDRRVNIGQTVMASFNTPSLFLIAKNLRRMQVRAAVSETDIGRIRLDMPVQFTVDACPNDVFCGKVANIRLNGIMRQDSVAYTVIVPADNTQGKLLPYLTASLHFELDRRPNVLMVASAALRWRPRPQQVLPKGRKLKGKYDCLWVKDGEFVRPIEVQAGFSNGLMTEIGGSEVKEGINVIDGELSGESSRSVDDGQKS